jgi:hypothetical protein
MATPLQWFHWHGEADGLHLDDGLYALFHRDESNQNGWRCLGDRPARGGEETLFQRGV